MSLTKASLARLEKLAKKRLHLDMPVFLWQEEDGSIEYGDKTYDCLEALEAENTGVSFTVFSWSYEPKGKARNL